MVPVKSLPEFKEAIRRKLLLEISGLAAPARVIPVQTAPKPRLSDRRTAVAVVPGAGAELIACGPT